MVTPIYIIEWCCGVVSQDKCDVCGRSFVVEPIHSEEPKNELLWVSLLTASVILSIAGFILYMWEFV